MNSGLEITVISVLGGIIVALITLGAAGFFWLATRIERLARQINDNHQDLAGKINERHQDLIGKINESYRQLDGKIDRLREDLTRDMEQMKVAIINALVNHSHPGPGGPPVFSVPPPVLQPNPDPAHAEPEPQPTPADD